MLTQLVAEKKPRGRGARLLDGTAGMAGAVMDTLPEQSLESDST